MLQTMIGEAQGLEKKLEHLNNRKVIVYAVSSPGHGYFIQPTFSNDRVNLATSIEVENIKQVISRNDSVSKPQVPYKYSGDYKYIVTNAIDNLSSESQPIIERGTNQLISMGCKAVPVIIKNMRDFRKFHGTLILSARAPESPEPFMSYRPKLVYDALSQMLSYITGANFTHSYSLNTQAQRDSDYHAWLVYLAHFHEPLRKDQFSPFLCR